VGHTEVGRGEGFGGGEAVFEDADSADGAADVELVVVIDDGDTGGVIAAVFEPLESFYKDRLGRLFSDIGNNSTHANLQST
jgi:hypothetical protein